MLPPEEAWVIATNKSFGLMGGSKLRAFGDPYSANVVLPKQLLIETIKSAVSTNAGPGVEDRQALAERMMLALDEGYEGFGWKVFESGRSLGAELKASLAKSLLDYFNDPTVPTSGDELTFFMTKEIMNRLAPSLLVVNFWDIDIAHYGAYSLYLEAIKRTDRLVHELWQHAQSLPQYRDRTTLMVVPELGRDGDVAGNGFANHRSGDESCRRVWLVARGRRRAEGSRDGAPDSDDGRRADGRADPRVQDAGVRRTGPGRTGVLNLVEAASTQLLLCSSTQDWSATPRQWRERTRSCSPDCRRPSTRSLSWSFRSGRRCSPPSSGTSARCSTSSPASRDPTSSRRPPASHGSRPKPAATRSRAGIPAASRMKRRRSCASASSCRTGERRSTPSSRGWTLRWKPASIPPDAPRRLVVQIYGSGIGVQTEKLWHRFKGTGFRVP